MDPVKNAKDEQLINDKTKISDVMKIPGLVDLQVNGYKGVDFSGGDLTRDDFIDACREMFESGTTAFLPTVVTSPQDVYKRNLPIIAEVIEMPEFAGRLLGIHLEGPFISAEEGTRGAHNAEWVKEPDTTLLDRLINRADEKVKLLTIAAEPAGAEELARYATDRGIAVSLGHQAADEEDLDKLVHAGAVALTHLGNGIPALLARHNNPVWAGLANDDLMATIITDGNHLPPSILKTIIKTKGPARCVVISDATSLAGFKPGRYETLGHEVILEENGGLHDPETGYMCGSSATMLKCMNHLASLDLLSPDELVGMGFYNPLRLIGLTTKDVAEASDIRYDKERGVFYVEK